MAYSELQPNEAVQSIANAVRAQLESITGKTFEMYTAILYKTQVVAGTNYLISVQTSEQTSAHIVVHESLDGQKRLDEFQVDMELYAPLNPIRIQAPPVPR